MLGKLILASDRRIDDDGFTHSLLLLRDIDTQGLRLQASVFDDELRKCPIWTAFGEITTSSAFFAFLRRIGNTI